MSDAIKLIYISRVSGITNNLKIGMCIMPIKSLKILNVMAFQRNWRKNDKAVQDGFVLKFNDGINVIIGENAVGKTTILKMIYAATQWSIEKTHLDKTKKFSDFFSSNLQDTDLLKNNIQKEDYSFFEVSDGKHKFEYSLSHKGFFNSDSWVGLNMKSVFIPTTEMLSHSKGFLALNQKYKLPFDGTQMKKAITLKMRKQLPFQLKGMPSIKREVISDFEILNFADWGVRFPDFKIKKTEN